MQDWKNCTIQISIEGIIAGIEILCQIVCLAVETAATKAQSRPSSAMEGEARRRQNMGSAEKEGEAVFGSGEAGKLGAGFFERALVGEGREVETVLAEQRIEAVDGEGVEGAGFIAAAVEAEGAEGVTNGGGREAGDEMAEAEAMGSVGHEVDQGGRPERDAGEGESLGEVGGESQGRTDPFEDIEEVIEGVISGGRGEDLFEGRQAGAAGAATIATIATIAITAITAITAIIAIGVVALPGAFGSDAWIMLGGRAGVELALALKLGDVRKMVALSLRAGERVAGEGVYLPGIFLRPPIALLFEVRFGPHLNWRPMSLDANGVGIVGGVLGRGIGWGRERGRKKAELAAADEAVEGVKGNDGKLGGRGGRRVVAEAGGQGAEAWNGIGDALAGQPGGDGEDGAPGQRQRGGVVGLLAGTESGHGQRGDLGQMGGHLGDGRKGEGPEVVGEGGRVAGPILG
jgi:hypothetical protein